ncbi:NUDIX domain-containing protein [Patescibacteria group bacterium]|nr:NUDIX domain-containing protein [Patescibacteria group bacterium]
MSADSMRVYLVAVCIVEHNGKIALIKFKRNYMAGLWGLPGGKLDHGEHLSEGATREIREELGIETELDKTLATIDEKAMDKEGKEHRFVLLVCRMRPVSNVSTKTRDLPEGTIEWFSLDKIEELKPKMVPSDYRILKELGDAQKHGLYRSKQEFKDGQLQLSYFKRVD